METDLVNPLSGPAGGIFNADLSNSSVVPTGGTECYALQDLVALLLSLAANSGSGSSSGTSSSGGTGGPFTLDQSALDAGGTLG